VSLQVLPIGGADMPVVISVLNSCTGLAAAVTGFAMHNMSMIIAGTLVGAAGSFLTVLMCKAMNRSLAKVIFGSFGLGQRAAAAAQGDQSMREIAASECAIMMGYARKVIIIPGYGLAVAQGQHLVHELDEVALEKRGVEVKYAIHPVAGRMPGHMNVLLAEPTSPIPSCLDMEEINPEFEQADVALIIGANDVVNPAARTDAASPIYGMPILNADKAKNVIVIKRGRGAGFRRHRERTILQPQNPHALRRRQKSIARIGNGSPFRAAEFQQRCGSAANRCQRRNATAIGAEVIRPSVSSRIEQWHDSLSFSIYGCNIGTLAAVTLHASKSQVF
jgi:H+-translocating NAD(P) transhydrogenase subunit beta